MTTEEFLKALSTVGNDPNFDDYINNKHREKTHSIIFVIACTAVITAVISAAVLLFVFNSQDTKNPSPGGSGETLSNNSQESPSGGQIVNNTENPFESSMPEPTPAGREWFENSALRVHNVTYTGMNSDVTALSTENFGVTHISVTVKGEHENCTGCYYNAETDEVVCLYHEFLAISGIEVEEENHLWFFPDCVRDNLFLVQMYNKLSIKSKGLWLYERNSGSIVELGLPEGCVNYEEVYVGNTCLWDGRLSVGVRLFDGPNYAFILDIDTGSTYIIPGIDGTKSITVYFLSDQILRIDNGGEYSFYNLETGIRRVVIGEYSYYAGGKVFSIKNSISYDLDFIEVAAYDAATGELLENEMAIVVTYIFGKNELTKTVLAINTTTGEETVILENCSAYEWSIDHAFFYCYSKTEGKLICFSVVDGRWIEKEIKALPEETEIVDGMEYRVDYYYFISVSNRNDEIILYYIRMRLELLGPAY